MRPKSFVIIFIKYVYTIDIPTMGSHRDNMGFVFTIIRDSRVHIEVSHHTCSFQFFRVNMKN